MPFKADKIPYKNTNAFSKLVLNYIDAAPDLTEFYTYTPNEQGLQNAINNRANFPINRQLLVAELTKQYAGIHIGKTLQANIDALLSPNTFTVCTAHQPNIFTGHLYFVYKILHAIKLCNTLNEQYPTKKFVPVYYMGSEDADIDELGEVHIKGKHYKWQTNQKGAVGNMVIDAAFITIIQGIAGQLIVEKHGAEIIDLVKQHYQLGSTIEQATFTFVHTLFGKMGLVVLLPNNPTLKNEFAPIVIKELFEQLSATAVSPTVAALSQLYTVQAAGRNINLFYLKADSRERIELAKDGFSVANSNVFFSKEEIVEELKTHPERFSANVIVRPLYQEMILPNIAFIGGGGELAYWLELKNVFAAANVFFPALILRNSFTIINKNTAETITKLGFTNADVFETAPQLLNKIVLKSSTLLLDVNEEKEALKKLYEGIKTKTAAIDSTLNCHVHTLRTQHLNKLEVLEKKMLKAEKLKYDAQQRQIIKIKNATNPADNLQERVHNILEYLAEYGLGFIDVLYQHSNTTETTFTILTEQ